jgi:PAS domain S-box-containing protein
MLKHSKNIPLGGKQIDNSVFALLDSFSDAAFLIDPVGTILDANTAFATRISNYSRDFLGINAFALQSSALHIPEIAAGLREKSQEVLRTGKRLTFEEKQHGKTCRHTITPSCARDGKITRLFIVVQDCIETSIEHEFALHKIIHEAIPCSIAIMDARGCFIWLNQYASDLLTGKNEDVSIGLDAFENMHPDDMAYARENFLNVLKTGNEVTVEVRRAVSGTTDFTWRIVHGRKIMFDGQPCVLAIGIDITERKRAEDKLIENQTRFDHALKATHAGVWEWDMRTGENIWSDELWELYGLERGKANPSFELWASSVHPEDRKMAIQVAMDAAKKGIELNNEYRVIYPDGSVGWLMSRGMPIYDDKGNMVKYIGTIIDITEHKQTEKKLIESQKRFSQALEATHAGVWEWDMKTGENIWSDEIWELYGMERGKANPSFDLWASSVHPEDREMAIQVAMDAAKKGIELNNEFRVSHSDGSVRWLMSRGMPLHDVKGNIVKYIGTSIDITERKQTENERQKLLESKAGINAALETSHIGLWEIDLQNLIVHRSLEHDRIFGYESLRSEWTYQIFLDHIIPEDREEVARKYKVAIAKQSDWNSEYRILRTDGEIRWIWAIGRYQFDKTGKASCMTGLIMDITERKRDEDERTILQAKLQQAQKMELVGQLAGGIAHDFNNVLTAILGNTELLLGKIDIEHPFSESLENIRQSVTRSADLVRQLLAFARKQAIKPKILQLDQAVHNLQPMLRRLIPENIQFDWRLNSSHARVLIDPSQFDQVMTNLCINARDAIIGSGTITIETSLAHIVSAHIAAGHPCQIPGNHVRLSISDTGSGIDLTVLPHIFEPFFTTKDIGKGTGLGLSTIYGIVKQNNGYIDCRTVPGKGTTFNVYLPMSEDTVHEDQLEEHEPLLKHTNETILVVEDESYILKILKEILEDKGYTVLVASDAEQAMIIVNKFRKQIALLVTDIMLPNMNGIELSERLQAVYPELKVLFMSGYAPEEIAQHRKFDLGVDFIRKPFTIQDFTGIVYNTLSLSRKAQ